MRLALAFLFISMCLFNAVTVSFATDTIAQNATERSRIFLNGYMDDSRIYQTQKGFHGLKLVTGTMGSGIASRTIDSQVYSDSNMDETSFTMSAEYDYRPYTSPLTQSDLRNVLCAKNYDVGSVYSERYTDIKDLIKDTNIYQNKEVSIYNIDSEIQGTARIGSKVQKNVDTVPSYMMQGTYIGYADINLELQAGNTSIMNLPCP
ncbi:MAG: hypothetical protein MUO26_08750 [Methanotrichaceae archaeon]|nr:hypothetical protein [Methanotrichaceae archaeon]